MARGHGRFGADIYQPAGADAPPPPLPPVPIVRTTSAVVRDGALTVTFGPAGGRGWYVRRVNVSRSAPDQARADMYVAGDWVAGTRSGNADENDATNPYYVPNGESLVIVWQSATGTATGRIEYVEA